MYEKLFKLFLLLKENYLGDKIISVLEKIGVRHFITAFFHRREAKKNFTNPTEFMLKSQTYFADNKERIERNLSFLSDKKSKEVYSKMIKYRSFSNPKEFPEYNWRQYFINEIFSYVPNEVYVDCGAYDGDSIADFKKNMRGGGRK